MDISEFHQTVDFMGPYDISISPQQKELLWGSEFSW